MCLFILISCLSWHPLQILSCMYRFIVTLISSWHPLHLLTLYSSWHPLHILILCVLIHVDIMFFLTSIVHHVNMFISTFTAKLELVWNDTYWHYFYLGIHWNQVNTFFHLDICMRFYVPKLKRGPYLPPNVKKLSVIYIR